MGYEMMEQSHGKVLGINCTGKITKEDYTTFLEPTLDSLVAEHGSVRLLFKMVHFEGAELQAAWHDTVTGIKHAKHFERVAMVGSKTWEAGLVAVAKPFLKAKVRYFDVSEETLAWEWLNEGTDGVVDLKAESAGSPIGGGSGRKFLVALDGSAASKAALEHAISFMNAGEDHILLVSVHPEGESEVAQNRLDEAAGIVSKESDRVSVSIHNVEGNPARAILARAKEHAVDYIFMGSHNKSIMEKLVGSVTDKVLKESLCPVLIVPPPKE